MDELEILIQYLNWKIDNFEYISPWYIVRFYNKTGIIINSTLPKDFESWKELNNYKQ